MQLRNNRFSSPAFRCTICLGLFQKRSLWEILSKLTMDDAFSAAAIRYWLPCSTESLFCIQKQRVLSQCVRGNRLDKDKESAAAGLGGHPSTCCKFKLLRIGKSYNLLLCKKSFFSGNRTCTLPWTRTPRLVHVRNNQRNNQISVVPQIEFQLSIRWGEFWCSEFIFFIL